MEDFNLIEEELQEILLHRDCHFAGQFPVMLDYYRHGGKGVCFEVSEIESAMAIEKGAGENLAPLLFSESDMKQVAKVRMLYQGLREICEQEDPKNPHPKLIAELMMAEEEDEAEALEAVVARGGEIIPELIQLATHEEFGSPLFPGYGKAPLLAIRALGQVGDRRAIIPLFEQIGSDNWEIEGAALEALGQLGEEVYPFLISVLQGRPITQDTERAVVALTSLPTRPEVEEALTTLLAEPDLPRALKQYLEPVG